MDNKKKQTAAIAAVVSYLKTEQEAVAMQAAAAPAVEHPPGAAHPAAPPLKVWGISGRQAQMQIRNMMQMKTFK